MWPDRVSNPGPLTCESGALPNALRGPASKICTSRVSIFRRRPVNHCLLFSFLWCLPRFQRFVFMCSTLACIPYIHNKVEYVLRLLLVQNDVIWFKPRTTSYVII